MDHETTIKVFVQQFTFGDNVPKEWFYERLGYDFTKATAVQHYAYMKKHDALQTELREKHGYILVEVPQAKSYRVLGLNEYAEYAVRRLKTVINAAFREHAQVLNAAPVEQLTDAQMKTITDEGIRAANIKMIFLPQITANRKIASEEDEAA